MSVLVFLISVDIPNESTQTGAFVLAASWDHNNGIFSGYKSLIQSHQIVLV